MLGTPVFYPSSPIELRDATAARVAAVAGLANVFKARTMPGQDDQMPYATVWLAGDRTTAWGDSNVGTPSLMHTITLVVDVMARAGDETALDAQIVTLVETIRATLLTDPTWVQLVESVERADTRYAYPKEAGDVTVQGMIEFEVTTRSEWPPALPNSLNTVAVTTPPSLFNGLATEFDNLDS